MANTLRSDIVDSYLPTLKQIKNSIVHGDVPLWEPITAQGRPLLPLLSNSYFHPLTLVLITVFPIEHGFSLLVMAKLFLAGLFMYLFLRKLRLSRAGAVLGGLAYMFSGFHIVWLMWPHTLVSAFAPLLFHQTENLVSRPTLTNVALLGVVAAIMLLGGFPSVAGYFFYAAGLYLFFRLSQVWRGGANWRRTVRTGGLFGIGLALGGGIAAFQLLPTLEHASFVDLGYRRSLSVAHLPIRQGIQLLFPNFHGNQVFENFQRAGLWNLNESSGYVGIITAMLAALGVGLGILRRQATVVFFGALGALSLLLVYGIGPFLNVVSHLPVFDINSSTRLLSVFGFAAAVAGGFGLDHLLSFRARGRLRTAAIAAIAGGGLVVVGMLVYVGYELFLRRDIIAAMPDNYPHLEFHTFRLITVALGLSFLALLAVLTFLHVWRPLPRTPLAIAIIVIVSADLLAFAFRQNASVDADTFYPEPPAIRFLQTELRPYERMAPFDGAFMIAGTQSYYGINSSFAHVLYSERQRQLIRIFSPQAFVTATALVPASGSTNFDSPIIDLLGIKYVTVPYNTDLFQQAPGLQGHYRLVYSQPSELRIYENTRFAPAFLVPSVVFEPDSAGVLAGLQDSRFDPRSTAYVEEPPPSWWTSAVADGSAAGEVQISTYDDGSAVYSVDAPGPALLVTSELDHPGWKASVDGESVPIHRANYIFRAVFVPAGRHQVAFHYDPAWFQRGTILTVAALVATAGLVLVDQLWRWRRSGH